ncbi:MAG: MTAP family purine nucleoside phosphorylase [Terriglobia bacterium]
MATIGVIGGSGLYELFDKPSERTVQTPYGETSSRLAVSRVGANEVVFIPRFGKDHTLPPQAVPYKANLWALKSLGVERIIAHTNVGSLSNLFNLGDVVLPDQVVNHTYRREPTYFDQAPVTHVSLTEPFCPGLRRAVIEIASKSKRFHDGATVVVIEGPHFATAAESRIYKNDGADLINMSLYPEVALARELGICYVNVGFVTDHDAGFDEGTRPVSHDDIVNVFRKKSGYLLATLKKILEELPPLDRNCDCPKAPSRGTGGYR